jgi:hypothetical protein
MKVSYFKPRKLFDFSPHPFDIGNAVGFWRHYDDNHFLLKLYSLEDSKFSEYYNYHLLYTLENKLGNSKEFFVHVWQIVGNRIRYYQNKDPFNSNHGLHVSNIIKLQEFQHYLNSIDQWNARPHYLVIAEKDDIIKSQLDELQKLHKRLDKLSEYEVVQKIRIEDEHLPTIIDLFQQMRHLELPSGRKLLRSDHKSPYSKMISKYFSHGGSDIPIETARNYFVEKKGDIPSKGILFSRNTRFLQ